MIAHAVSRRLGTRRGTLVVLTAAVGLAWWQTVADVRGMSGMVDGFAKAGRAMPLDMGPPRFVAMWTVMMAAMMLPGIVPVAAAWHERGRPPRIVAVAAASHERPPLAVPVAAASHERPPLAVPVAAAWHERPSLTGAAVAAGYLAVWLPPVVIALGALSALDRVGHPTASLDRIGGAIVVLAGAYQFTRAKRALLQRSPYVGGSGALRAGVSHGLRCLGSSWALMCVLFVVGVMNVAWMAAIGVICLAEKTLPRPAVLTAAVGVVLVAVGLVVLLEPTALDAVAGTM